MITVNINQGKGVLALPDGRTMKLNGLGALAQLSDGSTVFVGGIGPMYIPEAAVMQLVMVPTSGQSTTAEVTVSAGGGGTITPTGTVTLFINGVQYTQAALANGAVNFALPSQAFTNGPGDYTIKALYNGDNGYAPVAATATFHFSGS